MKPQQEAPLPAAPSKTMRSFRLPSKRLSEVVRTPEVENAPAHESFIRPDFFNESRIANLAASLPPRRWLVKDLDLCPGPPAMFFGHGYAGKTTIAQSLAISVATGSNVWGLFECAKGSVLHIDYEMGPQLLQERYQKLCAGSGIDIAQVQKRLVALSRPRFSFDTKGNEENIRSLVRGFKLVIIDSFRAACPLLDENSSASREPIDRLAQVSEELNVVILLLHHARKPSQNDGASMHTMRGSSAFFEASSSVLRLQSSQHTDSSTTHVAARHEKARTSGKRQRAFHLTISSVPLEDSPVDEGISVEAKFAPSNEEALQGRIVAAIQKEPGLNGGGVQNASTRITGASATPSKRWSKKDVSNSVGPRIVPNTTRYLNQWKRFLDPIDPFSRSPP